jgi:formyltetrahydrofolate hydrolase
MREREFILTLSCKDTTGIVYAVSGLLFQAGCNILDSQQFGDVEGEDATAQAHARGVKLIGATAHYVTPDLDERPIIEQDVARVDHSLSADDLTALGRDVECVVLARAVRWHVEHRV